MYSKTLLAVLVKLSAREKFSHSRAIDLLFSSEITGHIRIIDINQSDNSDCFRDNPRCLLHNWDIPRTFQSKSQRPGKERERERKTVTRLCPTSLFASSQDTYTAASLPNEGRVSPRLECTICFLGYTSNEKSGPGSIKIWRLSTRSSEL